MTGSACAWAARSIAIRRVVVAREEHKLQGVPRMTNLSTTAWTIHDLGLATSIGGVLFGQQALSPALGEIPDQADRDRISDRAWTRFSWINLAAHGVVAATWFVGRSMLSGREVSSSSRALTRAKDVLVIASLVTGVTSVILGRTLAKRTEENGRMRSSDQGSVQGLRKAVRVVGITNLIANVAIGAVTTGLSMEASKSLPFSIISRRLP